MILKELRQEAILTRAAVEAMNAKLQRIGEVYAARLPNVEWGTVEQPNLLKVTRVGFTLDTALFNKMISRENAIEHVRKGEWVNSSHTIQFVHCYCCFLVYAGVADLHELGFAHTDIKVANVFVTDGVAFLDDLEYVVKATAPARKQGRSYAGGVQTAADQDLAELELFAGDVLRL
jgi:hypothetical protein